MEEKLSIIAELAKSLISKSEDLGCPIVSADNYGGVGKGTVSLKDVHPSMRYYGRVAEGAGHYAYRFGVVVNDIWFVSVQLAINTRSEEEVLSEYDYRRDV